MRRGGTSTGGALGAAWGSVGRAVRYCFAQPLTITGLGKEEQAAICNHIASHLGKWEELDGIGA